MGYGRLGLSEPIDSVPELVPNQIGNVGSISSRRKRKPILLGLLFLLLLVVSGISATVLVRFRSNGSGKTEVTVRRKLSQAISQACSKTLYPNFCVSSLANVPGSVTAGEHDLFHISLNVTLKHFGTALYGASAIANLNMNTRVRSAYDDCIELLDDSYYHLSRSLSFVAPSSNGVGNLKSVGSTQDVLTWLSTAVTNQDTCMDGFADVTGYVKNQMMVRLKNLSMLVSNCLAIFAMSIKNEDFSGVPIQNRRRLMESSFPVKKNGFPTWMTNRERKLLETPVTAIRADFVVSKDGNGTHKTIYEAIKAAPEQSMRRIIIYVKAGRYEETYLKVGRKKTNLMFIGDGKGATIISGGKSVSDNLTTFHTASFAATGAGFIARDITFVNWAGPAKHQAVALRVGADHAVVYRCNIIGYQDTLYVHTQRQFYRECAIYGTVDFIFGNAQVVFQNCSIYARKPMPFQKNTITAQNRKDPFQNSGISIHNCQILATPDLQASKGSFSTYLGRPWKMYSRTVYMLSYIGDHIHPRGWLEWNATFALDTLYYGEYLNYGPGGAIGQRVKWPGYRVLNDSEANKFTVGQFIYGSSWLPSTGVAFLAGLSV